MRDVTRAKIPSLCGAIWRTILNFYASQDVWVNCDRIHQKSLNFIYPFKFYSIFTNKNVSWLHFSWPTQYMYAIRKSVHLKTKLLLHNRKLYLTYGMVLCFMTLTDLWTRRECLSASTELLVFLLQPVDWSKKLFLSHGVVCGMDYLYSIQPHHVCIKQRVTLLVVLRRIQTVHAIWCLGHYAV